MRGECLLQLGRRQIGAEQPEVVQRKVKAGEDEPFGL
jgi:hypothetical protein